MKVLVHDYAGHAPQVQLSRQLAVRGHDVTHAYFAEDPGPKGVLCSRTDDQLSLHFVAISIGRPYDKNSLVTRHVNDVEYGRRATRLIKDLTPDVVISGNTPTEAQAAIIRASKAVQAGFVYWMQDFYSIAAGMLLRKRLCIAGAIIGWYYRFLERRQLRESDAVVVISDDFSSLASAWARSKDKVHTIENWASFDELSLCQKENDWSREHGLDDRFVFLYTGTLGRRNNPEFLVRLAQECDSRACVVVVGQGVGMKQLEAAKAEHRLDSLRLLPLQPPTRFPEVLATGDVLVGLLEADAGTSSVPSKVQSYLCAGRPILLAAPSANLAARNVAREDAGIVVGPYDRAGFAAAANRLRDNPELRKRLGANGRAYAVRTFDIINITDSFEQILRMAVKRSSLKKHP
jgi:glycosyltransferase involved in cell wall biosynthesis